MSELWDPIFGADAVAAETSDRAWLRALVEVEAALARAGAHVGRLKAEAADAIGHAGRDLGETDIVEIGRRAAADGNPVIPLVQELRARVPEFADAVHWGATSQDILDTASMLVARRAIGVTVGSLEDSATSCRRLAGAHRDTPMAGRTLMQQAVATSFGAVVANWGDGIDRAIAALAAVRTGLAVQFGGAAGTLAAAYPDGATVRAALAEELGLQDPGTVWHTERSRIAELAGALGMTNGVVAKVAGDIVVLAQTELGEVHERAGGGSSAMPHKQNPIAAITARAAAAAAPGLVATLLAAMAGELQRGAGSWHSEWPALNALLNATGGAAGRLAASLAGLQVDPLAMARNLERMPAPGGPAGAAADLVDRYLARRRR